MHAPKAKDANVHGVILKHKAIGLSLGWWTQVVTKFQGIIVGTSYGRVESTTYRKLDPEY